MATTITPSITYAVNSTTQSLFTIDQTDGVVTYGTIDSGSTVSLDTATVEVGTDVSYVPSRGEWTLVGTANIAYTLQAAITTNAVDPTSTYGWYTSGNLIGATAQVGTPLSVSFLNDTATPVVVSLLINNAGGAPFQYPAQVLTASATVTEVSGYDVA